MIMQRRDWKDILAERRRLAQRPPPTPPTRLWPHCRWCGRKLAKATTYIRIAPEWQTTDIEATARLVNGGEIISYDRGYYPDQDINAPASERPIVGVGVWNGTSYKGHPRRLPIFCKTGCAIEFALDAHQHGHRRRK
jgi:hypothetical protein